jgi:hypothetical protein
VSPNFEKNIERSSRFQFSITQTHNQEDLYKKVRCIYKQLNNLMNIKIVKFFHIVSRDGKRHLYLYIRTIVLVNMLQIVKIAKCFNCGTVTTCYLKDLRYLCAICCIKVIDVPELVLITH